VKRSSTLILERTLRKSFWNIYDHLGTLIVVNIAFAFTFWLILPFPYLICFLLYVAMIFSSYEELNMGLALTISRQNYFRFLGLLLFYLFVTTFFTLNIYFYLSLRGTLSLVGIPLSGIMLWMLLLCLATALFSFPQIIEGKDGFRTVMRRSFVLLLDNLVPTGCIIALILSVVVLLTVTGAGLLLLGFSVPAVVKATFYREVMKQYAAGDENDSWEERRGFRDLFRPWEHS
jgi:uncharacterized membrane protein YesL